MDGTEGYHAEWNRSVQWQQGSCLLSCVIKRWIKEHKNEKGTTSTVEVERGKEVKLGVRKSDRELSVITVYYKHRRKCHNEALY